MTAPTRITLPMPRMGETMDRGTIANWMVEPGSDFKRGDPLLELETDKTLVEYPALGSGRLLETLVAPGDVVEVGARFEVERDGAVQTVDATYRFRRDGRVETPRTEARVHSTSATLESL